MSTSRGALLKATLLVVVGGGLCVVGGFALRRIIMIDPLRVYKESPPSGSIPGVEMTNFDWKFFNGAKLVAEAHVQRADVGRDREQVKLETVRNGKLFDNGNLMFGFETDQAVYWTDTGAIKGDGRSRVFNRNLDVASQEFQYDPRLKALVITSPIMGKLSGGSVKATGLTYHFEDKSLDVNGIKWSGMLAQDDTRRPWSFTAPDGSGIRQSHTKGPITTYTEVKATDGEIIVIADSGEYNKDTDVLTAKGHVQYFGSDANMTCDQVVVDRKNKKAVMTGSVDMLVKAETSDKPEQVKIPPVTPVVPDQIAKDRPQAPPTDTEQKDAQEKQLRNGENVRDYPVTIKAGRIEYWYQKGKRHAVITGSPQARQEFPDGSWRMVWSDEAAYDREHENLDLKSTNGTQTVRMLNSLGDDMVAISVSVSTKKGEDRMDALGVSIRSMPIKDKDLPEDATQGKKGGDKPPPDLKGPIGGARRSGSKRS